MKSDRSVTLIASAILAAFAVFAARPACAQAQTCIAHHPLYLEGRLEIDYVPGCTGHDEPELFPFSSAKGSGHDLTWTVILPTGGSLPVSSLGPAFWFGGVVSDPS